MGLLGFLVLVAVMALIFWLIVREPKAPIVYAVWMQRSNGTFTLASPYFAKRPDALAELDDICDRHFGRGEYAMGEIRMVRADVDMAIVRDRAAWRKKIGEEAA